MPGWLVEGNATLYVVFGVALTACLAGWWRTRRRTWAIAASVAGLCILGVYGLDRGFESDDEQVVRKVREVAAGISAKNIDAAFRHVSDGFDRGGVTKPRFKAFADHMCQVGNVTDVQVWDLNPVNVSRESKTGTVEFHFKVRGNWGESPPNYFGRVVFSLDSDGQWRVKTFDVYDALNQSRTPVNIPGWGGR